MAFLHKWQDSTVKTVRIYFCLSKHIWPLILTTTQQWDRHYLYPVKKRAEIREVKSFALGYTAYKCYKQDLLCPCSTPSSHLGALESRLWDWVNWFMASIRDDSPFQSFSSVQWLSRVRLFVTPWIAARQDSLSIRTSGVYSDSSPSSWWCHPTISSSVIPFSSCLQSFPASGSFQMSQFFASGGQSIRASASVSVLPMNIQDWFSLGLTGWISLQPKGLSRVFSNITVGKY